MERWAKAIVENNTLPYCQQLRYWWAVKGRSIHGRTVSDKATDALTYAMLKFRFRK